MKSPASRPYRICAKTIMDTSDPNVIFDADGVSDYFHNFQQNILPNWHTGERGAAQLRKIADEVKREAQERDFDCIIGLSGGLDSSYAAYVAKEIMGLRPLIFHVDAGWNTQQAVGNIEKIVNGLGLDLYTEVIDWEEMKDLQVAFLRSQIADQDLPQDAAFFSALYRFAVKNGIKTIITGGNYSTECCREPEEWGGYPGIDVTLFRDIHRRFGKAELRTFPLVDLFQYRLYYKLVYGMRVIKPLNLIPYVKKEAEALLGQKFGWEPFLHKHHESRFTRFYEDYWMPQKFGYEKRRAHFSSLILTGQMTRDEALARISRPELGDDFWRNEIEFVANKLGLSRDELEALFRGENRTYKDYKSKKWLIDLGARAATLLGAERRLFR